MPGSLRPLIDALAREAGRESAAQALASEMGARHLLMCVQDPELKVMLPAPGMPKTLASGPSWRTLLQRLVDQPEASAEVDLLGRRWQARAIAVGDCAFVLLGEQQPPAVLPAFREALPLLAETLRAQQAQRMGLAEAREARLAALRAQQLARALDAARAAAASLNRQLRLEHQQKDEFLAMLAHELRNPMAPVLTGIEILRRIPPGDVARRDRQLDVMGRQMQQLTHLVDDLLDVSRVSRGLIELRKEVLALDDVLAAAAEATRPLIASRRHLFVPASTSAGMYVLGDRVRLVQVFSNLLNNAAKYTEPGGRIAIEVSRAGQRARISVQDDGAGIPREMLAAIFEMFTQVPGSLDRAPGGLGIGLTLVRMLVDLHGGGVRAHSDGPGCGSRFVVDLPLVDAQAPSGTERTQRLTSPLASLHVLVVDDNRDAAETMAEAIRLMGPRVSVVHDGAEALRIGAAADPPQLVLLDLGLPGIDGYETAREWRRRFGTAARLVAVTGYGSDEDRRRTARSGFDRHLVKPVCVDVVEALLSETGQDTTEPAA